MIPNCDNCTEDRRVETYAADSPSGAVWVTRCIECGQSFVGTDAPVVAQEPTDAPEVDEEAPEVIETDEPPAKPSRGRKAKAETPEA